MMNKKALWVATKQVMAKFFKHLTSIITSLGVIVGFIWGVMNYPLITASIVLLALIITQIYIKYKDLT